MAAILDILWITCGCTMYPVGLFSRSGNDRLVRDLAERLENLERDFKRLRLEWEDAYDKLRQIMGRLNKRIAHERDEAEKQMPLADQQSPDDGTVFSPMTGRLSQRQREIQQSILRRRAGG